MKWSQRPCSADDLTETALAAVPAAHIDRFQDPTLSALTFAMWFYRLDPENWFSFDRMYEQTRAYVDYYVPKYPFQARNYNTLLEIVALNGVPGTIIEPAGIAAPDLITFVNYPEQSITIWMTTLYD